MNKSIPFALLIALAGCGKSPPTTPPASTAATPAATPPPADISAATQQASQTLQANTTTWSPEALEDLLAPVALYPDPVLMQLLVAVTNPQEVLDAGNWLIANPSLTGKAQDDAVAKAGFTMPMRVVMQFPEVLDKLCLSMPWTEELGQAYVNDQQGVMDAVQRLRVQAKDVGNLKTTPQMKVETKKEPGKPDVVTVSPPNPQVIYVPQYDPQAAYAAASANPPPPGTTVSTTTTTTATGTTSTTSTSTAAANTTAKTEDKGHSTGSMVATGLLAFGAGLLVADIFHDNDDWYHSSYYGPMWHGPMPYYPPYPYRPVYGPGFYPGHAYVRPPTYIHGGNTIVINQNNNYYNRYNNRGGLSQTRATPNSPITAARPNRPELQQLNARAAQGPARRAPTSSEAWKGKGGYLGSDPQVRQSLDRQAASSQRLQANRPAARGTPSVGGKPAAPKIQGSYAGARPAVQRTPAAQRAPASQRTPTAQTRPVVTERPDAGSLQADRGRASAGLDSTRVTPQLGSRASGSSALGGMRESGSSVHQASQRGHQSLPANRVGQARATGNLRRR